MMRKSKRDHLKSIKAGAKRQSRPEEFKGKLRYKRISGGVHRHSNGQVVRKGEILYANPEELSPLILKSYKCLDDDIQSAAKDISLGLRDRGNGWYDVINKKTGETLNDTAMRAKDARQFITGTIEDEVMEDIKKDEEEVEVETEETE